MTLGGAQLHPDPQQQAGNRGAEPGRQDDGVAQGPLAQEDGDRTLLSRVRGLGPQSGHVSALEEPSVHGEAG